SPVGVERVELFLIRLLRVGQRRLVGLNGGAGLRLCVLERLLAANERNLRRAEVSLRASDARTGASLAGLQALLRAVECCLCRADLSLRERRLLRSRARDQLRQIRLLLRERRLRLVRRRLEVGSVESRQYLAGADRLAHRDVD